MTITIADGRGALWQWDTGRRVKITDGDSVKQIHYQKRCFGCSVDVDVEDDGTAIIPDELLQDCHTLTAYAYVTDDAGGYTKVQQDFAVYNRPKPSDYVYTPTEHAGFDRLRAEIGDLADLTTEAKDTLVAAINEVASAGDAGSMALRVSDGYIQYSTDSGSTWQNLIAVAELKGADGSKGDPGIAGQDGHSPVVTATKSGKTTTISVDGAAIATVEDGADGDPGIAGKDGAGMDITGAKVGQIAKITAVDTDGVPTAWSPVDMPSGGGVQSDWNQNDDTQPDYVKNRPFYSETRNVTVENVTDAALEGFPTFVAGDTVTVNVDGVEHSLVAYYDEDEGVVTIGDIYSSIEDGKGQLGWQIYASDSEAYFYAKEAHTISYLGVFIYKIDDKFLNLYGLVRTYNYYFNGEWIYKTLYNDAGDECTLYTCSDFILPDLGSQLFGFMNEFGFSKVNSVSLYSCFITGFIITPMNAGVRIARVVLGTDTSDMETMPADNGYTYTTNPNA